MSTREIQLLGGTEAIERRFTKLREIGISLDRMRLDSLCSNVTRDGQNYSLTMVLEPVCLLYAREFAQVLMLDSPKTNELRNNLLKTEPPKDYMRTYFDELLFQEVSKLKRDLPRLETKIQSDSQLLRQMVVV
jgi:hypothetical protein